MEKGSDRTADLSEPRRRILDTIQRSVRERGYPPTIRELAAALGFRSASSVHHHLRALEDAGLIEREPALPRAISVTAGPDPVKLPDELDARLRHEARRRGITISELTREAIDAYVGRGGRPRELSAAASGCSGRDDVSERIEEILTTEAPRSR